MTVSAVVSDDTTMAITETIAYDFGATVRHGIYRDIPVYDELSSGEERHYGVEVTIGRHGRWRSAVRDRPRGQLPACAHRRP